MKKILCLGAFLAMIVSSVYAESSTQYGDGFERVEHTWSYAALAQTMKVMRLNCEPTRKDEFLEIGNWTRNKKATFSMIDLLEKCLQTNPEKIVRTVEKPCKFPNETQCEFDQQGVPVSCGENVWTENDWCNIFISTWIKYHNDVIDKIGTDKQKPGTYVEKRSVIMSEDRQQRTAYKVVDVVLSDEYYVTAVDAQGQSQMIHINQEANQDEKNTKIYEIKADGIIDEVPNCSTWTNDMFMDIQASSESVGDVRGAVFESYIFCDENVTQYVYEKYDKRRGLIGASVMNAVNSIDGQDFDIKVHLGKTYKTSDQTGNASHSNGLLFNGRVATIDFLGNMLYGMNREEAVLPNVVADALANLVSIWSARKNALSNGDIVIEPETVRNAWDVGSDLVKYAEYDNTFKNIQTKNKEDAYHMTKKRMLSTYNAVAPVVCHGNCNPRPMNDDVVVCIDANGMRREFVFDDICD